MFYVVAVWLLASLIIAVMGSKMRFGFWGYLFASLLLTPVIGVLLLAAAYPPKRR
jgi:multisubunit Na+/H+ antiporter MnhG subunit